jgi:hypothetical protein
MADVTKEFFSVIKKDSTSENPFKYTIGRTQIIDLFARKLKKDPLLSSQDTIIIGPEHSPFVKDKSITTVGIFLYNKIILEDLKVFGYYNGSVDGDVISKLNDLVAEALLADDITTDQCRNYIDSTEWFFGGPLSHIINPSISTSMLTIHPETEKLKNVLLEKHKTELEKGNTILAAQIEKQICDDAWERLVASNDPSIDIYKAKAGLDFYNNYKTMFVMKGPVLDNTDPTGTKYNVITSDLDSGISKKDFTAMADSGVLGSYSTGVATASSGYYTKKYNTQYQNVSLLEKGSDCGSKKTIPVLITEQNKKIHSRYRYHMVNGKPELLTKANIDKYIGKTIHIRTPLGCEAQKPHFCNICYGNLSYMLDKTNVGNTYSVIPNTQMNADLKKKHDVSIKLGKVNVDNILTHFK